MIALNPLNQEAHRQLMRLYAEHGQTDAAERQYRECARIIGFELGLTPDKQTRELRNELVQTKGAVPLVLMSAGKPPHYQTRFVGRTSLVSAIGAELSQKGTSLLTLTGPVNRENPVDCPRGRIGPGRPCTN